MKHTIPQISLQHIDDLIKRNLASFAKPGAMTVRPGYEISNGWVTGKQAIVVTVDKKTNNIPTDQLLPQSIGNIPVDVREATGLQRLKAKSPSAFDLAKFHMRGELREPDWQFERSLPLGHQLPPNSSTTKPLGLQSSDKTEVTYCPPEGVSLSKYEGNTTIIACASPDAGYDVLKDFLSKTASELTIAMYDFTSADLLNDVTNVIKNNVAFKMVLDHPAPNPTADQSDEVTRQKLIAANASAQINWALTKNDPLVNEWIFPNAYHIKVVVRDGEGDDKKGKALWLSSGNFNNSNEPNASTTSPHKGHDRDWHVVVLNEQLADMYKAFIENDFNVANSGQGTGNAIQHHLVSTALDELNLESAKSGLPAKQIADKTPPSNFPAKTFNNVPVIIQPLLTPDKDATGGGMYVNNILDLIASAKTSLYIQTQYIHPSDAPADTQFMQIFSALKKAKDNGIDVRVILSEYENTSQWIEKMEQLNLVDGILKIQDNVHNKGIVVDSKIVMVSSENWSSDGVLRNRDAGLIIQNEEIAKYFEIIFLDDWTKRANLKIKSDSGSNA